jgi:flagellar basal body-associated protein FliL
MLKSYINSFNLMAFMRKRNRVVMFLLMPIIVFMLSIGWSLYWTGSREDAKPRNTSSQNELAFTVQVPEEKYAT